MTRRRQFLIKTSLLAAGSAGAHAPAQDDTATTPGVPTPGAPPTFGATPGSVRSPRRPPSPRPRS